MFNLLGAVAPMIKTLFSTIDKTIDNKAEAEKLKQSIQQQLLSGQLKELEAQAKIITAEAQGGWLQRNWRPILMLVFAGLVVAHWFGFTAPNIPESVQNSLLNIVLVGVGGYIVGRSGEKIMDKYKK
jgi:uncharacterized membrane protein|tara:strand:+ start:157 stop:537 length:381 start_codon:yes stop_codon:yes gene_type:complete